MDPGKSVLSRIIVLSYLVYSLSLCFNAILLSFVSFASALCNLAASGIDEMLSQKLLKFSRLASLISLL